MTRECHNYILQTNPHYHEKETKHRATKDKWRILGECLLISSLQGKVLRTLIDIARLAEQFNKRSQSQAW